MHACMGLVGEIYLYILASRSGNSPANGVSFRVRRFGGIGVKIATGGGYYHDFASICKNGPSKVYYVSVGICSI